ncbi:MAG: glycosyltransferase [Elusimicrobiaceae bacterium]|nr:glycosyltransferase [Elusimicrobiaceae bacterium]
MNKPKVSIIVPIYGVEKYLHQCVDSILAQTLKEIEIILVDDGSKDKCPQIVDEYSKKDPRVIAVHQPNGGYGRAVNHGIELAKGEYIGIVESDDWIEPNMYEELYNKAIQTGVDIVKSNFFNTFSSGEFKNTWAKDFNISTFPFNFKDNPIFLYFHPSIWSCLYKRNLIIKNNIRMQEIPGAGWTDNLFQVKTLFYSQKIVYIDDAFYHYRRKHVDDAKDLKDWHIPFNRTKEIHEWMRQQKITDINIWGCLYKRELGYMYMALRMIPFKQIRDAIPYIIFCVKDMEPNILSSCPYIKSREKNKINSLIKYPLRSVLIYKVVKNILIKNFKTVLNFMISIHISSDWIIQLLGIQIAKGKYTTYPALIKFKIGE